MRDLTFPGVTADADTTYRFGDGDRHQSASLGGTMIVTSNREVTELSVDGCHVTLTSTKDRGVTGDALTVPANRAPTVIDTEKVTEYRQTNPYWWLRWATVGSTIGTAIALALVVKANPDYIPHAAAGFLAVLVVTVVVLGTTERYERQVVDRAVFKPVKQPNRL